MSESGTRLYLIRHGIAVEREIFHGPDSDRPLTAQGEQKTRRVAQRLKELKLGFDCLLTSPLLRAQQTANILQAEGLASAIEVVDWLAPGGDFGSGSDWLEKAQKSTPKSIAFVGHEPDLSQWAELLLSEEVRQILILKKAGIIGLLLPEATSPIGNSLLFWLSAPGLLL
ncbi:MAG: phosphohistidine phosphatase SixA [Aphanocapsa sp. GSE-SYN-MK-11-07L]|jgi:phosphohistidine phosphatase|nr:phosphohistidine phosphatase SixA [Aphanocapsa sp. GSE-SYN-MK-11-07L]